MITYCLGNFNVAAYSLPSNTISCDNEEMLPSISSFSAFASNLQDGERTDLTELSRESAVKKKAKQKKIKRQKPIVPFNSFTMLEYVRYQRALKDETPLSKEEVKLRLSKVALKKPLKTKLKRLSPVEFRALTLAIKLESSSSAAFINFEKLKFCRKNKKLVLGYIRQWEKLFPLTVYVSDKRFMP